MDIKRELGIGPTADKGEIRRAYARRLKEVHPEDDPEGFQRLRAAYEAALNRAEYLAEGKTDPDYDDEPIERPREADRPPRSRQSSRPGAEQADDEFEDETPEAEETGSVTLNRISDSLDGDDEEAALKIFEAALSDPVLLNLNNRRRFELGLLQEIGSRDPVPPRLAESAVAAFGWDEHWTDLPGEFQDLADRVMSTRLSAERLAELRQQAKSKFTSDYAKIAARFLLGPYRPVAFSISAGPDLCAAMGKLLDELRHQHPSILTNEVDSRVLAWWELAVFNKNSRLAKRSRWITWSVIGLSFLLGLAQVLLKHA